ncbi:hypothetical protein BDW69DRAFT_168176 [Aspergillus filifer]
MHWRAGLIDQVPASLCLVFKTWPGSDQDPGKEKNGTVGMSKKHMRADGLTAIHDLELFSSVPTLIRGVNDTAATGYKLGGDHCTTERSSMMGRQVRGRLERDAGVHDCLVTSLNPSHRLGEWNAGSKEPGRNEIRLTETWDGLLERGLG